MRFIKTKEMLHGVWTNIRMSKGKFLIMCVKKVCFLIQRISILSGMERLIFVDFFTVRPNFLLLLPANWYFLSVLSNIRAVITWWTVDFLVQFGLITCWVHTWQKWLNLWLNIWLAGWVTAGWIRSPDQTMKMTTTLAPRKE